ncbi:TPA: hypothetical protein ACFRGQ_001286 [Neisseria lactamica]|nr:hypothetical protein [Neisseria lactamica]
MPSEARRRLQTALPQQTATVFRHTAHYPAPHAQKPRPVRRGTQP